MLALKDLTFLTEGNPDKLADGSINFYKWRMTYDIISNVLQYQDMAYPAPERVSGTHFSDFFLIRMKTALQLGEEGLTLLAQKS